MELLGAVVVSRVGGAVVHGRIAETEAYLGYHDPASHGYLGRRYPGNVSLYADPGCWYVYRSYGIHWCANLVSGPPGSGGAVLLRGVEIEHGDEVVAGRRMGVGRAHWANGPGKLCQALGIDRGIDGASMPNSSVVVSPGQAPAKVRVTPRVGISKAVDWLLRFEAVPSGSSPAPR